MTESNVLDKVPGLWPDERTAANRLRVALTGLTMAEYFRDEVVTYCCSSTTFIVIHLLAQRFLLSWVVCVSSRLSANVAKRWAFFGAVTSTKTGSITSILRYTSC